MQVGSSRGGIGPEFYKLTHYFGAGCVTRRSSHDGSFARVVRVTRTSVLEDSRRTFLYPRTKSHWSAYQPAPLWKPDPRRLQQQFDQSRMPPIRRLGQRSPITCACINVHTLRNQHLSSIPDRRRRLRETPQSHPPYREPGISALLQQQFDDARHPSAARGDQQRRPARQTGNGLDVCSTCDRRRTLASSEWTT